MKKKKEHKELMAAFWAGEYHKPLYCTACGGIMMFKGAGEYACENCHSIDYDDYGKVRLYLESHEGALLFDVEAKTGVDHRIIRRMLRRGEVGGHSMQREGNTL